MKSAIRCLIALPILAGCAATPMPESYYDGFGLHTVYLHKCYEKRYIEPKLYADGMRSLAYLINTWSYDEAKLNASFSKIERTAVVNTNECRDVEAFTYQRIAQANQHRASVQAEQARLADQQAARRNDNAICYTLGGMTFCDAY